MQALIRLLGQQQQGNVMGAMGGTLRTGMQHLGQGMEQQAQQQMGMVQGAPAARLKLAMEKLKLSQEGPQEALGGQTPDVFKLLTARQGLGKYAVNPATGGLYNVHTGQEKPPGKGGAVGGLDPKALDQMAEMFHTTGQLPQMGMGQSGAAVRKAIINRAAELHPDANLAGNKAGFHADQGSLASLQKSADAIDAFEQTAGKNLDQFLSVAKGPIDTGSPLINKPLRSIDEKILGSPEMTAFNVARRVAVNEIAKVLSNPGMGGVLSDSARHEVESLIGPDATLKQIYAAAGLLKQDMANRKAAMAQQIGVVRGRASGQSQAAESAPSAAAPPDAAALRKKYGL